MSEITSFRSIIELWPSREALAADLPGASSWNASKWWQRDSIPAEWWASVLSTETARQKGITAELMARLAAREVVEARV